MPTADREGLREELAEAAFRHAHAYPEKVCWAEVLRIASAIPDGVVAVAVEAARANADTLIAGPLSALLAQADSAERMEAERDEAPLDDRLRAAGMFTIPEMMGKTPMTRWETHAGMNNLTFFGEWLDMKVREYLHMRVAYELGDKSKDDELYEWVLAHVGAFMAVRTNFKAAAQAETDRLSAEVKALRAERFELRDALEDITTMAACWRDTGGGGPMPFALKRAVGIAAEALTRTTDQPHPGAREGAV